MQKLTSAYAKHVDKKGKTAKDFVEESEVLFVNEKKATRLLSSMGFTRPMSPKHSGYIGNIYRTARDVKIEGIPFSDVFEEVNSGPFALRNPKEKERLTEDSSGFKVVPATENEFKDSVIRNETGQLERMYINAELYYTPFSSHVRT